jgi:hypothetical protein
MRPRPTPGTHGACTLCRVAVGAWHTHIHTHTHTHTDTHVQTVSMEHEGHTLPTLLKA